MKPGEDVAVFIGIQQGFGKIPNLPLFNLKVQLGEFPANSTVAAGTLARFGYLPPKIP